MLLQRVITAVVLLLVLFAVLIWGGDLGWLMFVSVTLFAAFWEWARLGRINGLPAYLYAAVGLVVFLLLVYSGSGAGFNYPLMALAGIFWVSLAPWCLSKVSLGPLAVKPVYLLVGLILMAAAGLSLMTAHSHGLIFLLSVVAICWAADIFAYVFGKLFGRRKLAPRISPGKSWEGALGGTLTVVGLSWVLIWGAGQWSVLSETWQYQASLRWSPALMTVWLIALSALSIAGDLLESLLKRKADLKDSSRLLPGHGGVLDRIDAQLPVLPISMLLLGTGALG